MKKKTIIIFIFLICIIIGISLKLIETYRQMETEEQLEFKTSENTPAELETIRVKIEPEIKQYPKEEIIEEYKGYTVCAKLEIPSIELETHVLKNYSVQALNVSVTKFWGVDPNEIGNFCIAGHNFKNKNMFRNLKKLNIGEKIVVSDNKIGKIEYEIYDIYKVVPKDISCLSQETEGKREVTLITCTSDSKERIIVKAREVE